MVAPRATSSARLRLRSMSTEFLLLLLYVLLHINTVMILP